MKKKLLNKKNRKNEDGKGNSNERIHIINQKEIIFGKVEKII